MFSFSCGCLARHLAEHCRTLLVWPLSERHRWTLVTRIDSLICLVYVTVAAPLTVSYIAAVADLTPACGTDTGPGHRLVCQTPVGGTPTSLGQWEKFPDSHNPPGPKVSFCCSSMLPRLQIIGISCSSLSIHTNLRSISYNSSTSCTLTYKKLLLEGFRS